MAAGTFDLRVLEQTTYWVDGTGKAQLLTEMAPRWRRNIGAFLFVKARGMHAIEALYEATGAGAPAGQFLAVLASGAPEVAELDPYDWLAATPFFAALRGVH